MDRGNREYTNGEITVKWKPAECNHSGICFTRLIEVFNPRKRPWVDMKGASTEKIIEIVDKCPTRALSYYRNNGLPNINQSASIAENTKDTEVHVMQGGPLVIEGTFEIVDEEGQILKSGKMTSLCRCGQTRKRPFCDGAHREFGFDK